jgi:uncharacterized membrane protein YidH (DUF202 family)
MHSLHQCSRCGTEFTGKKIVHSPVKWPSSHLLNKELFNCVSTNMSNDMSDIEEGLYSIRKGGLNDVEKLSNNLKKSKNTGLFAIAGMRYRNSLMQRRNRSSTNATGPRSPARVEPKAISFENHRLLFVCFVYSSSKHVELTTCHDSCVYHIWEMQSFFANERTFIQWITVGSLFMFVAGIVYAAALSAGSHQGKPFMIFGNGLIGCALFVVVYGTAIYYRRLHLMISKWFLSSINLIPSECLYSLCPALTDPYLCCVTLQMQNLRGIQIRLDLLS